MGVRIFSFIFFAIFSWFSSCLLMGAEALGPSSRRTGFVLSEVMYRPGPSAGVRDLEFVEIYNSQPFAESLAGHRLSGDIDFAFSTNTVVPARGFLVVAKNPADLKQVYGITNVVGPYTNRLGSSSGTIRLRNKLDAVLLEMRYSSAPPWMPHANGAGHSLVLARPSFGEGNVKAWAASDRIGGSPGKTEPATPEPLRAIRINELLAHTDPPLLDYVELFNSGSTELDLGGCVLTDDPSQNRHVFPAGRKIPARGFVILNETELGFSLKSSGESLFLKNSAGTIILDAIAFGGQENGVSFGRFPDGSNEMSALDARTPGLPNSKPLRPAIVINEIMYNPISRDDGDEFVELHNTSTNLISLGDWRFLDGIDFKFPKSASIPPLGYVVVAKNLKQLREAHPHLNSTNSFGDYNGTLSNGGERILLAKSDQITLTNASGVVTRETIWIAVNEVDYQDGGRWGRWSDGGGSSLELIDPFSNNKIGLNWGDSDETLKSEWTLLEHTGPLIDGDGVWPANFVELNMLGESEALVDDVEVFTVDLGGAGPNLVPNAGFEAGLAGWISQGTHDLTTHELGSGVDNSGAMHVRAVARGDYLANRVESALLHPMIPAELSLTETALPEHPLNTATIRAKARWLKGRPQIMFRIRGGYLELAGELKVPKNLGTPGLPNSRLKPNAGPGIEAINHFPVLPQASQSTLIRARVEDPDGISSASVLYRVDPQVLETRLAMNDAGLDGDEIAGDGIFSARIPPQESGTTIAFRIHAEDAEGAVSEYPSREKLYPTDLFGRECLIRYGEAVPQGNLGTYRMWMTQATFNQWTSRLKTHNGLLDVTFVYNNDRIIYNAGSAYVGSAVLSQGYTTPTGAYCGYNIGMPSDEPFLGVSDISLDWPIRDPSRILEQICYWMGMEIGVPGSHRRFIHLHINGVKQNDRGEASSIYEDAQQPNSDYVEEWEPDAPEGDLYKIEVWWRDVYQATVRLLYINATLQKFTKPDGSLNQARYRWTWQKRAVKGSAHDYSRLFDLVEAVNDTTPNYVAEVERRIDTEEWVASLALRHIVGDADAYGFVNGHNMYAYQRNGGKWRLYPYDIDFFFDIGGRPTNEDVFAGMSVSEPTMYRMVMTPVFRRAYLRALENAVNGPMDPAVLHPRMDAITAALASNGISPGSTAATKTWINQRREYLRNYVRSANPPFAITSNGGLNFSSNTNLVLLTGNAPIAVKTIRVNGVLYPITWSSVTSWQIRVPVQAPLTTLNLQGYDYLGRPVPQAMGTIRVNYTGPVVSPMDNLVINEIHYNALTPGEEFVEIHNITPSFTFNLTGYRLEGVDFDFPEGTFLEPGKFLLIARNREALTKAFGKYLPIAGEYSGSLDRGGETLRLVRIAGTIVQEIDRVPYDDDFPWPVEADGTGASLQLLDPLRDNSRVANWAVSTANPKATPGITNSVKKSLAVFPSVFINEIQPKNNGQLLDSTGAAEPWIELYNAGSAPVNLAGLFLSHDPQNLRQWAFPSPSTINPGQYLLIWADGQPAQSVAGELHANFRLSSTGGLLALSRTQDGQPAVLDYLHYGNLATGRSMGSYPDGQNTNRLNFDYATPGKANDPRIAPVNLFINEWMASNFSTIADPADGDFDDWVELYNAGPVAVDLSGYRLGDRPDNLWSFPAGTMIEPGQFLLIWADEETGQPGLHASFKLSQSGEAIYLYNPAGVLIDSVVFQAMSTDQSRGRYPDGLAQNVDLTRPTPGAANQFETGEPPQSSKLQISGGRLHIEWKVQPGYRYQLEYKNNLNDPAWTPAGEPITAGSSTLQVEDTLAIPSRFYRLQQITQ